jgi:hypothetical protein
VESVYPISLKLSINAEARGVASAVVKLPSIKVIATFFNPG